VSAIVKIDVNDSVNVNARQVSGGSAVISSASLSAVLQGA